MSAIPVTLHELIHISFRVILQDRYCDDLYF